MEEMRPYPSSVRSRMRGYKEVLKGISKKNAPKFHFSRQNPSSFVISICIQILGFV